MAIAREEGFYFEPKEGERKTRAQRNNNPGNIVYGQFAELHKAIGTDGHFAIFASASAGFDCLRALLSTPKYQNVTLEQAIAMYAPSIENDTNTYLNHICEWTGKEPHTLVKDCEL